MLSILNFPELNKGKIEKIIIKCKESKNIYHFEMWKLTL